MIFFGVKKNSAVVLILSKSNHEYSTEHVLEWLINYKVSFYRINGDEYTSQYGKDDFMNDLNLKEINAIWYRRWQDIFSPVEKILDVEANYR